MNLFAYTILIFLALLTLLIVLQSIRIFHLLGESRSDSIRKSLIKKNIVKAEYEPLKSFTPAELGFLHEGKLHMREVVAMDIWLSQGNSIPQRETISGWKGWLSLKPKIKLNYSPSNAYADIADNKTRAAFIEYDLKLQSNIRQYYDMERVQKKGIEKMNNALIIAAIVFGLSMFFTGWLKQENDLGVVRSIEFVLLYVDVFLVIAASSIFFYLFSGIILNAIFRTYAKSAGINIFANEKLKKEWRSIEGFLWFLEITEFDRIEQQLKEDDLSNPNLAYAVALDRNDRFLKYFTNK